MTRRQLCLDSWSAASLGSDSPLQNWEELARDLRLARRWCDQILIHSLEGRIWQGFLTWLRDWDWSGPAGPPPGTLPQLAFAAPCGQCCGASAHPRAMLGGALTACLFGLLIRRHPRSAS